MSKYTTEVRFICETKAGLIESVGYGDVERILSETWDKIFDFDFPMFNEEYRSVLCQKILKHYYTREIAFETVGLWKLKLNTMMNEIMPYYNQLYESALLKFNPLLDADYTKEHEGKDSGVGNETGTRTGSSAEVGTAHTEEYDWDVYSDTPQGALTNVENNTYLTNARKVTRETDVDTTTNRNYTEDSGTNRVFNNTDEYIDHVFGKFPGRTYSTMLKEFRETFLNIDVDIIGELSDLFLKLW